MSHQKDRIRHCSSGMATNAANGFLFVVYGMMAPPARVHHAPHHVWSSARDSEWSGQETWPIDAGAILRDPGNAADRALSSSSSTPPSSYHISSSASTADAGPFSNSSPRQAPVRPRRRNSSRWVVMVKSFFGRDARGSAGLSLPDDPLLRLRHPVPSLHQPPFEGGPGAGGRCPPMFRRWRDRQAKSGR